LWLVALIPHEGWQSFHRALVSIRKVEANPSFHCLRTSIFDELVVWGALFLQMLILKLSLWPGRARIHNLGQQDLDSLRTLAWVLVQAVFGGLMVLVR